VKPILKKCCICGVKSDIKSMLTTEFRACCRTTECATKLHEQLRIKEQAKRDKAEAKRKQEDKEFKQETKRRKKKLLSTDRNHWIAQVQFEFNRFIRYRDRLDNCISCGRTNGEVENGTWRPGGYWDAGHYKSRGAFPELRFVEDNCHKQCKCCNGGSGKYQHKDRTVSQGYTQRLREKIGKGRVDWLNGPHCPLKPTIEELMVLHRYYKDKNKVIKEELI